MLKLYLKNLKFSHGEEEKNLAYDFLLSGEKPIALLGESGSGKTTLLDLIAGFLAPHEGKIFLEKEGEKTPLRPLSYLRQNAPLFEHLTVQKNLSFSRASLEEIRAMAEDLGIIALLRKRTGELSGGQYQRVLLGQTLLQKRPLILLDEPFKGLDQSNKEKAMAVIKKTVHSRNALLVFTTHDERDVLHFGARKILL